MKNQRIFFPNKWTLAAILTTAALTTGAATTYWLIATQSHAQIATDVEQVEIPSAVAALGYLEPKGELIQVSAPAFMEGARVETLLVQRGDTVTSGEVIAILDSRDRLQAALIQAEAQMKISEARLKQVQAGAKQGDIMAQNARFKRTQAELEGQMTTQKATIASLAAELAGEKSAQQAIIERINSELVNAHTDCQRYRSLYADGVVSEQEQDSVCLEAETTAKTLQEAQANLQRIVTTLEERIKEAKANLDRTIVTLAQQVEENQATLVAISEVRDVDVEVAQAQLLSDQAAVQRAKAELELTYVRSPKNGQILKIHTNPGELVSNQGIVDLGQTDEMYVRAEVYETDINRIKLGQTAQIEADGIAGKLTGTVAEIGLQIGRQDTLSTDPVADADARVVEVKIRLTPESSQKVSGLTNLKVNVIIEAS